MGESHRGWPGCAVTRVLRVVGLPGVALVLCLAFLVCVSACGGLSLSGTTWKGGNLIRSDVTISFTSDIDCTVSATGTSSGTYATSGDQVEVRVGGEAFVFQVDGDVMQGTLWGAPVSLAKQ
jgi:hypothetical protein